MPKRAEKRPAPIIRREEIVAGGHHGGAWKVAYADFVTAMMAFFLLMWLINATTEAQKRGLADYFSPTVASTRGTSGSGRPFAGRSPFLDGEMISDRGAMLTMNANAPPVDLDDDGSDTPVYHVPHGPSGEVNLAGEESGAPKPPAKPGASARAAAEAARAEAAAFTRAAAAMQQAVAADPKLAPFAKQLSIDLTPQGLRVQIRDDEREPMFATGQSEPNDRANLLLRRLGPILAALPEPVSIAGYTDAAPYAGTGRTNWDLSTDRANAARRILVETGLPEARLRDVTGHADRDLLLPQTPLAAANRRISILLWRLTSPAPAAPSAKAAK